MNLKISKNGQKVQLLNLEPYGPICITVPYNSELNLYILKNINIIHNDQILEKLVIKFTNE